MILNHKIPRNAKAILRKKNKADGITLPDFEATLIKTDTQNNGTKSPEINTCTHSQLVYDKGNRIYNGKKITSSTSGAEETGQPQ